MITRIFSTLGPCFSAENPLSISPKKVNLFFGPNGSGKTTISRLFYDLNGSAFTIDSSVELKSIVFNNEYIENTFYVEDKANGIYFTMGEAEVGVEQRISELNKLIEEKNNTLQNLTSDYDNNEKEIASFRTVTENICWDVLVRLERKFQEVFTGTRSKKSVFLDKVISIRSRYVTPANSEDELAQKYGILYAEDLVHIEAPHSIIIENDFDIINNPKLSEIVISSGSSSYKMLVDGLQNHDWVLAGLQEYVENANSKCPFCQRTLNDEILDSVKNIFDKHYLESIEEIKKIKDQYRNYVVDVLNQIRLVNTTKNKFVHDKRIIIENIINKIDVIYGLNLQKLDNKVKDMTTQVILETISDLVLEFQDLLSNIISRTLQNNTLLSDRDVQRRALVNDVWNYVYSILKNDIDKYINVMEDKTSIRTKLIEQISAIKKEIEANRQEYSRLEATRKSVRPVVDKINVYLTNLGFTNFSLIVYNDSFYKLVRPDGTDAFETISEGEKKFVTFLYFYYSVQERYSNDDNHLIVVIDDPFSSLDSTTFFVITALIDNLIKHSTVRRSNLKQLFILTHSVTFHYELNQRVVRGFNENLRRSLVHYYVLEKRQNGTAIIENSESKIKSTYKLLWDSLKLAIIPNQSNEVPLVLNNMRRILEYYFSTLNGKSISDLVEDFKNEHEQYVIANSLVKYLHSDSHNIFDDIDVSLTEQDKIKYLRVFRLIFQRQNQLQHYNMMMGINEDEQTATAAPLPATR